MSEVKEITTLNTVASVRRAAQEAMRPVIEEVERKIGVIEEKMQQVVGQIMAFPGIEMKMTRTEESNRFMHGQLLELSDSIHNLELQTTIDREQMAKIDDNFSDEMRRLFRQKDKQDLVIATLERTNAKTIADLADTFNAIKVKEDAMQDRFHLLSEKSQQYRNELFADNQGTRLELQQLKQQLSIELKEGTRRMKLLDMYEAEREFSFQRFHDIALSMESFTRQDDFQLYKKCNSKEQERVVHEITTILEQNLSLNTRQLISQLPQLKEELEHCLKFESEITHISGNMRTMGEGLREIERRNQLENERVNQFMLSNFSSIERKGEQMERSIGNALSLEGQINNKIDEYSDQLKTELRQENEKKNRQLYQEIKVTFADTREAMREKELQRVIEERRKLYQRCDEMEQLGGKIQFVLTNFATKFTKIKSDSEMFEERVGKELEQLQQLRSAMKSNNTLVGQALAEVVESILASYCLQIDESAQRGEQILLTTLNDGVIYQKFANSHDKGTFMYRRRMVNPMVFRKAMAFSLLETYDQLMDEGCCLRWHDNSPSSYFRQTVEPIYNNLYERRQPDREVRVARPKDTLELSTIHPRQTISSIEHPSYSRNTSTARPRRNRYTTFESGEIFAHKSTRRVRGPLNPSLGMN